MEHSHNKDRIIKYGVNDDPIYQIQEHSVDLKANHIYLMGSEDYIGHSEGEEPGVDYSMANRFIKNMNILMRHSDDPILIHMKTCGGDWAEGMAIYDTIKACPNDVIILNYTHARSMSSIIFQAADKRVMMPHSTFMIHDGTFAVDGTVKQALTEIKELEKINDQMMKIYIDSMKSSGKFHKRARKFINDWLRDQMDKKEEVYFSAKQAVEYGFADEILGENGCYDWKALLK